MTFTATTLSFPFDSPSHRFQVVTTPVTYVCAPATDAAGNGTGTLTRLAGICYPVCPADCPPGNRINSPAGAGQSCECLYFQLQRCGGGTSVPAW